MCLQGAWNVVSEFFFNYKNKLESQSQSDFARAPGSSEGEAAIPVTGFD